MYSVDDSCVAPYAGSSACFVLPATPGATRSVCYFLAPGVYTWKNGLVSQSGLISNDLKPPEEAVAQQYWETSPDSQCAGSFNVNGSGPITTPLPTPAGATWSVVVTSARTDTYTPPGGVEQKLIRESEPSKCRDAAIGADQGIQVVISNVPGAKRYNIYAKPGACVTGSDGQSRMAGPAPGLIGTVEVIGGVFRYGGPSNDRTHVGGGIGCPDLPQQAWPPPGTYPNDSRCTLGYVVSPIYDGRTITSATWPPTSLPPNCPGLNPPLTADPKVGCPLQSGRDRANSEYCPEVPGDLTPCITAGAAVFFFPSKKCLLHDLNPSGSGYGGVRLYSGAQYGWVVVYADKVTSDSGVAGTGGDPPPLNDCGQTQPTNQMRCGEFGVGCSTLMGNQFSEYTGIYYTPNAPAYLTGYDRAIVYGVVIVKKAVINGSGNIVIRGNPRITVAPAPAKLVR
jgi:hypothetical protein